MSFEQHTAPAWLGVHEPTRLHLCRVDPSSGATLGLRVCAPGVVHASAVRLARVPHVLALALRVAPASDGSSSSCAVCAAAAANWADPGRLAVQANSLTNVVADTNTDTDTDTDATAAPTTAAPTTAAPTPRRRLARTDAGAWHVTCTLQGACVRWGLGVAGVVELRAVTWCGTPVPLPVFPLLWDDTAVACELGLHAVASKHRTSAVCVAAVRSNMWNLPHVPVEQRTLTLCTAADSRLELIPRSLRTPELCWTAVLRGESLDYVPHELRTSELCLAAVQQNGMYLYFVPDVLCTPELCAAAVQNTGEALYQVPHRLRTTDLCATAIRETWAAHRLVPLALQSPEMDALAVLERQRQRDEGFIDTMGHIYPWTPAQLAAAVRRDGAALGMVSYILRTPELCALAMLRTTKQADLDDVPHALRTPALCAAAVQHAKCARTALFHVPEALRTPALCWAAVRRDGDALKFVPTAHRTADLCLAALQAPCYLRTRHYDFLDIDVVDFIPLEYVTSTLLWAGLEAFVTRCVRPLWAARGLGLDLAV